MVKANSKKLRREAEREARRQHEAALHRVHRHRRFWIALIPLFTLAAAAITWFALEQEAATGAILLGGAMVWLFTSLGFIGSNVEPRDRIRAGSIDFGRKRK